MIGILLCNALTACYGLLYAVHSAKKRAFSAVVLTGALLLLLCWLSIALLKAAR